jgi:hypothetical protein
MDGATGRRAPHAHGRVTLFSVAFQSQMTDADLARLHASLDLATYRNPKPGVSGASTGVARLDLWSGLFLEPGEGEGEWALEGRTWGNPPEASIHEWHVRAALAARELDPQVKIPERTPAPQAATKIVPVGRAANTRHSRIGRRLTGLE